MATHNEPDGSDFVTAVVAHLARRSVLRVGFDELVAMLPAAHRAWAEAAEDEQLPVPPLPDAEAAVYKSFAYGSARIYDDGLAWFTIVSGVADSYLARLPGPARLWELVGEAIDGGEAPAGGRPHTSGA